MQVPTRLRTINQCLIDLACKLGSLPSGHPDRSLLARQIHDLGYHAARTLCGSARPIKRTEAGVTWAATANQ